MIFNFSGMVGDDNQLILPLCDSEHLALLDNKGKKYLAIECSGEVSNDAELIESLSRNYVEFSSAAFPHILQPLMQQHNVMINPDRPLIIYESMSFELDTLDIKHVKLELASSNLIVNGKRGAVTLEYVILGDGKEVGHGCKRMVLSGLREYDQAAMEQLMKDLMLMETVIPVVIMTVMIPMQPSILMPVKFATMLTITVTVLSMKVSMQMATGSLFVQHPAPIAMIAMQMFTPARPSFVILSITIVMALPMKA
jgi:hypothetical protein